MLWRGTPFPNMSRQAERRSQSHLWIYLDFVEIIFYVVIPLFSFRDRRAACMGNLISCPWAQMQHHISRTDTVDVLQQRCMLRGDYANGVARALLGGASSELVGGACLGQLLEPALRHLRDTTRQLQAGERAAPLVLHGSAGVLPPLRAFLEALTPHVPESWGDAWGATLQLEGTSAVNAAISLLRQRHPSSRVAVGACSYHGPPSTMYGSREGSSPSKPPQVVYPVPAAQFQHAGEAREAFLARVEREQDAFLRDHAESIGVLLVEPQWGSAALGEPWPRDVLTRFVRKARARGILVCADEIMCGVGRHGQGRLFLVDAWGVEVDAITFGKSIATGTFPLAGVLVRQYGGERVGHSHTFSHGAHALALLTATEVLRALPAWHEHIRILSEIMAQELQGTGARGQGLLWGVPAASQPEVLHARCLQEGLDVYQVPGGVLLTPLVNANGEDLRRELQRFHQIQRSWFSGDGE